MSDCYNILEVERTATPQQIKQAYRKMAMKWHPDRNRSSEATKKFQDINKAYAILSDPVKKRNHDLGMNNQWSEINAFDIFNQFFTGRNAFHRSKKGDIEFTISPTLEQICAGKKLRIKYVKNVACKSCNGKRTRSGKTQQFCKFCDGRGTKQENLSLGGLINLPKLVRCSQCKGEGKIIDKEDCCPECRGSGTEKGDDYVIVNCTLVIESSHQIFRNQGNYLPMLNSSGSLILRFKIKPHLRYSRIGQYDLSVTVEINVIETLVGYKGKLIHPSGNEVNFKTAKGETTINGDVCIINGQGINEKGVLVVNFKVIKVPNLSGEIVEELRSVLQKHELIPSLRN